jgi:ubiquitin-protein ligase
MTMIDDPRYRRLLAEQEELTEFAMGSQFIEIEPVESQPGWPPDEYIVTYRCRGIVGVDDDRQPLYDNEHKVSLKFSEHFPMQEPQLKWLTPIWHPNIEHKEPRHVCTDNPKTWWAGKRTTEIVQFMGELVQYQRYYAQLRAPFPIDREVAEWVREYAEPNRIIGPDKPVDNLPHAASPIHRITSDGGPQNDDAGKLQPEAVEESTPPEAPPKHDQPTVETMTFGTRVLLMDEHERVLKGPTLG